MTEEAWLVKEKLRVEVENGQVGDAGWWLVDGAKTDQPVTNYMKAAKG